MDNSLVLNDKHLSGINPRQLEVHETAEKGILLLTTKSADRRIGASGSILLDKAMALELLSYLENWALEQAPLPEE